MTSSVASGEDSNSHSNGSGGGEYSGDNSDTESSGDNKEGSGDVMDENNDDEDAMRHVSKPTQTTSRPRNTRYIIILYIGSVEVSFTELQRTVFKSQALPGRVLGKYDVRLSPFTDNVE